MARSKINDCAVKSTGFTQVVAANKLTSQAVTRIVCALVYQDLMALVVQICRIVSTLQYIFCFGYSESTRKGSSNTNS